MGGSGGCSVGGSVGDFGVSITGGCSECDSSVSITGSC